MKTLGMTGLECFYPPKIPTMLFCVFRSLKKSDVGLSLYEPSGIMYPSSLISWLISIRVLLALAAGFSFMSEIPSNCARALRCCFQQIASVRHCSLFDLLSLRKNDKLVHHGTMRATIRSKTGFNSLGGFPKGFSLWQAMSR